MSIPKKNSMMFERNSAINWKEFRAVVFKSDDRGACEIAVEGVTTEGVSIINEIRHACDGIIM